MTGGGRPLSVFIVVGEESGDQLGARLMEALIRRTHGAVHFTGVGGERMREFGLSSLFPLHDIAVMGIGPVLARLPTLLKRIDATVKAVVADAPDVLVIIDSPDFTHRVARRVRKLRPNLPIVDYVSPSVWAWRPGRARGMAAYVDHLLAILPFEPDVHRRLGGPPTTYVGHPLVDRRALLTSLPGERTPVAEADPPTLLVLPGSRASEVGRLLKVFAEAVARLAQRDIAFEIVIPAVAHLADTIAEETADWPVRPRIVAGETAKFEAFRTAHAAIAASGTVTLELALSGVPMVVAYRLDTLFRMVKAVVLATGQVQVASMVLPNIILGRNVIPELLDAAVTPEALAAAVAPLLSDTPERRTQVEAFDRLWTAMALPGGQSPADAAADVVLDAVEARSASATS